MRFDEGPRLHCGCGITVITIHPEGFTAHYHHCYKQLLRMAFAAYLGPLLTANLSSGIGPRRCIRTVLLGRASCFYLGGGQTCAVIATTARLVKDDHAVRYRFILLRMWLPILYSSCGQRPQHQH